jgi:competence protein ComEC
MPLVVHFLNVGEGDCTIIEFPSGHVGMVDISNVKTLDSDTRSELLESYSDAEYAMAKQAGSSALARLEEAFLRKAAAPTTDALEYFDAYVGPTRNLFRLIVTHPHMDHISGLHRLYTREPKGVINFWHTGYDNFDLDDADWSGGRYSELDWLIYKQLRASESDPKALHKRQGDEGEYWTADGIEIWAPTPELEELAVSKNNQNILSMVLKISHAGRSILLGGDATATETWPAIYEAIDMTGIDVLKASHHGRNSGYHQPPVKEMSPRLTITSVGQKEHDATEKYRRYSDHTVSMRFTGNIRITIDDDGTLRYPLNLEDHWRPRKP